MSTLTNRAISIFLGVMLAAASLWGQAKTADPKTPATTPPAAAKKAPTAVAAAERCIAKTEDGDQCKRKASGGKKYCWQHDPNRKKTVKKPAAAPK